MAPRFGYRQTSTGTELNVSTRIAWLPSSNVSKAVAAGLALAKWLGAKVTAVTAIEPWLDSEQRHSSGFHGVPESGRARR